VDPEQVTGGLIFVVFGSLFLASQTGHLPWNIMDTFFKFWPLLLIIPGLSLIFLKK
jgi:uncharacterized protein YybS (DUF2232 family)